MELYLKKKNDEKKVLRASRSCILNEIIKYKSRYILLLPALIVVLAFSYMPMMGIIMAFQKFDITKGIMQSKFVGFDNFITIFTYPQFLKAIQNTLLYSSVILFCGFPLPIILALLFNEIKNMWFKKVVQTITYLPYFLSWISVIALFSSFFSMYGTFNDIRVFFFGQNCERINILMDAKYFLTVLFSSHVWKNIGWSSVIFMAAISGIDPSLYEAATVDGCGRFKQILYITIPGIMETVIVIFIMGVGSIVTSNFEQVYGFQNAYTQQQTEVINTLVYRQGIMNSQYSLATAFGISQGLVSIALIYITNKIARKTSGVSIW